MAIIFIPGCVYICILILEILSLKGKSSEGVAAGSTCDSLCLLSVHGYHSQSLDTDQAVLADEHRLRRWTTAKNPGHHKDKSHL